MTTDGDIVYIAYGPGVTAVDIAAEEQLWSFPVEASNTLQFYAEPSINDGRIVLGDYGASGGFFSPSVKVSIYALNEGEQAASTSPVWVQDAIARDRIVAAPIQAEGLVFVGTADNFVLALEADTGALAWQFEVEHSIWSTPTYEDGILYVGSLDKHVYALDAETGDLIWKQPLEGSISGDIAVGEEMLYVGSFDKQLHALDKATGQVRWSVPEAGTEDWIWAGPSLVNEVVYFADKKGNVYAVNAETGATLWSAQVGGSVVAAPVVNGDRVFIASAGRLPGAEDEGIRHGALIALDAETGEELWREETSAPLYTAPVLVGDSVVIALPPGQENLLIVYNQEDGDEVWRFTPPVVE
jgi:outer membrane protein assembly factor BamB